MNNKFYYLKGKQVIGCGDLKTWAKNFERENRKVDETILDLRLNESIGIIEGQIRISTVFLGIDHSHSEDGTPLLFETMVFGGKLDQKQERCSTWGQAEVQHDAMVRKVKANL